MTWVTVLSKAVVLPVAAVVRVSGVAVQGFPSGANQWGFQLYVDGELFYSQGFVAQVSIPLGGWKFCAAGSRLIELKWSAHPSVSLQSAFLTIEGILNTTGV